MKTLLLTIAALTAGICSAFTGTEGDVIEVKEGIALSVHHVKVEEGKSTTITARYLDSFEGSDRVVTITPEVGGDADLTVSVSSLTFTQANCTEPQEVTFHSAVDADDENGLCRFYFDGPFSNAECEVREAEKLEAVEGVDMVEVGGNRIVEKNDSGSSDGGCAIGSPAVDTVLILAMMAGMVAVARRSMVRQ